ncbi:L-aspartate oxidase, chloroplastic [Vitis vinifera]|uniref:L-aspartate oxidase n=1 Tax=Vitis vinifera TaxID=29760 RepID=A0A438JIP8_VITVI|nr:L-aspartate oxidase, chloroplastic [Vitis vinifera]
MTTAVAAGSSKLHFRETVCRGQSCGQASWVSGVTFKGCPQKGLSGYLFGISFLVLSESSYEFDATATTMSSWVSKVLQIQRRNFCQSSINDNWKPLRAVSASYLKDGSVKYFDFAVIGSGVAGLRYALEVAKHGSVAVITKAEPHESNTNYAQGGVSAVLCPLDSVESHMRDTIIAGAYLCDEETVRAWVPFRRKFGRKGEKYGVSGNQVVCTEGPDRIRELIAMGASFDHGEDGNLHLAREGGHSHHRIVHAADMTGREIERALLEAVVNDPNIFMFEHHFAIDLLTSQDGSDTVCHGVDTLNTETQEVVRFIAKVILLASGGAGHIYPTTTNPLVATGDGIAMAHRAQAVISNMEFVQFHPTALADEGLPITPAKTRENAFLITEAVRGDGGILYNLSMERFMPLYDERAELAPRDVVARSIDDQLKKRNEKYVLLDISHKPKEKILSHFPNIAAECLKYGLDITRQPIPVVPAAHYMCGGVRAGLQGETNVRGLYVAGEVACTGLHGANRLASNSLLEALVFARRAVQPSIDHMNNSTLDLSASNWWAEPVVPTSLGSIIMNDVLSGTRKVRKELQSIMWKYVGIVRSTRRLKTAEQRIAELEAKWEQYLFQQGWEPTMVGLEACEMRNLFCCAKLVVSSALARHESRGLHYTIDFLTWWKARGCQQLFSHVPL